MKKIILLILISILAPLLGNAKGSMTINSSEIFNFNAGKTVLQNISKYPKLQGVQSVVPFSVNQSVTNEIFTRQPDELTIKQFPITAQFNSDVVLEKSDVDPFANTQVTVYGDNNKISKSNGPKYMMYSGKISGEPNSLVNIVYVGNNVFSYIKQEDGTLSSIGPSSLPDDKMHYLIPHELQNTGGTDKQPTYACLTDDYVGSSTEQIDLMNHKGNDKLQGSPDLLQVNIICEGAYDYYEIMGEDKDRATAYIYSVIAMTAKIYHEFLNVNISVSDVVIRTSQNTDPYTGTATLEDKLSTMPYVWQSNPKARALVVLFADLKDQPANTVIAGISFGGNPYKGSLCSNTRGYCALGINGYYTYPTYSYTWDVNVAAHEMGHNFSAPHTHNCYFSPNMIDTCVTQSSVGVADACIANGNPIPRPGTIMSYCHVTNSTHSVELIFHPREIPLMRKAAEDCGCVSSKTDKFISLLEPLGDSIYKAGNGSRITVRWTSSHIGLVNIYLSTDHGTTWGDPIAVNVPAADTIYTFETPMVMTEDAFVMVKDAEDPAIFDTGIDPCSIKYQDIRFTVPREGDSYAKNESFTAAWTNTFTDNFKLELTTNGGTSWETLLPSTNINNFEHDPINQELPDCRFRLTSLTTDEVVLSPVFSIGNPSLTVKYPNGGEYITSSNDYIVVWDSKNIQQCKMDYSTNNGATWNLVSFGQVIDATAHQYKWNVPNMDCDSALIRFRSAVDGTELDRSDNVFKLFLARTNSVNDNITKSGGLNISAIAPNPVNNHAEITVENPTSGILNCELLLTDESGKVLFSISNFEIGSNSQYKTDFSVNSLPDGSYFVILKSGNRAYSYPIRIVK